MNIMIKRAAYGTLKYINVIWPALYFMICYSKAARNLGNMEVKRHDLFSQFLDNAAKLERCLQISVKEEWGRKFGANWVSVDKFDQRDFIDYNYDIQMLQFPDSYFDSVACISVLNFVEDPHKAISELNRVLKPGGEIWIQVPFNYQFMGWPEIQQHDYWRVSPDGLRLWMQDFEEICCGNCTHKHSSLVNIAFFYGKKREKPAAR